VPEVCIFWPSFLTCWKATLVRLVLNELPHLRICGFARPASLQYVGVGGGVKG